MLKKKKEKSKGKAIKKVEKKKVVKKVVVKKGKKNYNNHIIIALISILVLIPTISIILGNNEFISKSNAATVVRATSIIMIDDGGIPNGGRNFKITIGPSSVTNKNITCTSSNTSIARIELAQSGDYTNTASCDVYPLKNGTVTITARTTDGSNLSASKTVTFGIKTTSIKISFSGNVTNGDKSYLVDVMPLTAQNRSVTCTSSNTSIATVEAHNNVSGGSINYPHSYCDVHPIKTGTVTITARTSDGTNLSSSISVTSVKVASVGIANGGTKIYSYSINVGQSKMLNALIGPNNVTLSDVTWTSSNTSVLAVTSSREVGLGVPATGNYNFSQIVGTIRGIKAGTATLTATAKDGSGVRTSITVTVKDTTKPTCITTGGSTIWYNRARTITVKCSDVGSGVYSCNGGYLATTATATYDTNMNTTQTYTVRDKVGNTNTCTALIRIDKTAPARSIINSTSSSAIVTCGADTGGSGLNTSSCIRYCVTPSASCTPSATGKSGISLPGISSNLTKCARTIDIAGNMSAITCRK